MNREVRWVLALAFWAIGPIASAKANVLLEDDFGNGFDSTKWYVEPFDPAGSTYIDGTQLRVAPFTPSVHGGYLDLTFSTYNPTAITPGDSFFGSQIISHQEFSPTSNSSLKFTCRGRIIPPSGWTQAPSGMLTSMFLYRRLASNSRDEIDIEILTKAQPEGPGFLTNSFDNASFSAAGDLEFEAVPGFDFRDFHVYVFVWGTDAIQWFVDGRLVRVETDTVPIENMALYFNTWAPLFGGFSSALDPSLQPATSAAGNIDVIWQLDYVRVESVPEPSTCLAGCVALIEVVMLARRRGLRVGSSFPVVGTGPRCKIERSMRDSWGSKIHGE